MQNSLVKTWSIIVAVAALTVAGTTGFAQDRSTPELTVRSFAETFGSGDLIKACACVQGAKLNAAITDMGKQIATHPLYVTLSQMDAKEEGDTATVSTDVLLKEAAAPQDQPGQRGHSLLDLKRSGGLWLIVPNRERTVHPAPNQPPDVLNSLVLALADTQVFATARGKALSVSCLSNIKQIALGAMMYLQDYDEKFGFKPAAYKKSLMPYLKNEAVFHCPSDKSGTVSYSFNASLAGRKMAQIGSPARTVMLYEGKDGKLDFRHKGFASVAFADGHAKLISATAAKSLRWKP